MWIVFVPEIVPKARGTSQHNLMRKTQFKLGFRVLFMCFGCKLQDHAGNTFRVKATTKS